MTKRAMTLGVVYPAGVDPQLWAEGHSDGQLPDRWPYGLHRLNKDFVQTTAMQARPLKFWEKTKLASGLLVPHGASLAESKEDVSIAWDEYTAAKMVSQYPGKAMFSGVIWATDLWKPGDNGVRASFSKRLLRSLTGLWCLSRPQVGEIEKQLDNGVAVDYLPFGIDHKFFDFRKQQSGRRVLSLGIDRHRDPETLLASLEIVHRAFPETETLVQTSYSGALPPGVTRFDRVPHATLRDLYRRATVVVIPTKPNLHASGMTVALEAGATGRPVVACSTPGMEDYVIDGQTGVLVPTGDPVAFAAATLEILADSEFASSLGLEARKHVVNAHTSEIMVEKLRQIISKRL
ncbi:glycosyltransferase family 4 protein [Arthrobacter sp. zg-ZUI100]|uniref:glycosyltransferase family 4 protein n=1 Tax=Arthrobacter jiangjiafuii TaxID=2817475 RepID=UPI001AEE2246|nr:glycosyltransferase family 4 protein [Arthrobacter jiangjiafuii]MBP3037158.1 glycosyltransferase family 4 protein [Arthrobacter jiangjiafuii]